MIGFTMGFLIAKWPPLGTDMMKIDIHVFLVELGNHTP
jgi:hypothetical protein